MHKHSFLNLLAAAGHRSICFLHKKRASTCTVFLAHMAHVAHGKVRPMYSLNAESTVSFKRYFYKSSRFEFGLGRKR